MTLARVLAGGACVLALFALRGADDAGGPGDLESMRKEQRELAAKMHQQRTELLAKDQALKELHQKVMALHRELALRLDNHRDLRDLAKRMRELEVQIRRREEALGIKRQPDQAGAPGSGESDKGN